MDKANRPLSVGDLIQTKDGIFVIQETDTPDVPVEGLQVGTSAYYKDGYLLSYPVRPLDGDEYHEVRPDEIIAAWERRW